MTAQWKILIVGAIAAITAVLMWQVDRASRAASLDSLFSQKISDVFYADAAKITGKQALQVAKLQQTEFIERTSSSHAFWIDLPDVVVRAKVPVEYSFFVQMNAGWTFRREGGEILVEVPELTNSTPAVDVGKLEFDVVRGSFFRNESAALKGLRAELMGLLSERAIERRNVVRDQARESVTAFVVGWLAGRTGTPINDPVRVLFPGEPLPIPQH